MYFVKPFKIGLCCLGDDFFHFTRTAFHLAILSYLEPNGNRRVPDLKNWMVVLTIRGLIRPVLM